MKSRYLLSVLTGFLLTLGGSTVRAQQPAPATPPPRPAQSAPPAPPAEAALALAESRFFEGDNFLGVYTEEVTKDNTGRFGLREPRGVGVTNVVKGSPAERAGLRANDVIVRFDGEAITSVRKLNRLIDEAAPGHTARLTISRGGAEQEVTATLGRRENSMRVFGGELLAPGQIEQWRDHGEKLGRELKELGREGGSFFSLGFGPGRRIGVTTSGLTDQLAEYFGVERGGGVLVTSVRADSPAAKAGLRAGDVITAVDGERVTRAGELSRALGRKSEGEVTLTVVRDKNSRPVKVTPERVETPQFEIFTDTFAPRAVAAAPPLPPRVTVRPRVTAPPRSLLPLRPLILRRGPSTLLD